MDDRDALLAELGESREHAAALLKAKLDTLAAQVQDLASRIVREVETVLPPDLEVLFPLAPVGSSLEALEASIAARVEAARPPTPAPAPAALPAATPALKLEVVRKLDAGRAQSEILQEFLRQLGPWAGPRAIVVFKDSQAVGWAGAGFGASDPVRSWRGTVSESPALTKVTDKTPVILPVAGDALLDEWFGGRPGNLLLVPMMLRGKVVGALLACEGEAGLDSTMVQLLTFLVGLMLETLAVRTQVPCPTILDPLDLTTELPEPALEQAQTEALGAPDEPVQIEEPTAPPEAMPSFADSGATMQMRTPIIPEVAQPVLPVVIPPVAPPPAATVRTPEEQRRHDEAKRFARLLVSEIRLYNEQAVQEGKQTHDIYRRLKEDIDRSQEMFEQRIGADIRASSNYFYDELVRILSDGDPDALGL